MARLNIDSAFFGDKRIDRLAALGKELRLTTMGRLLQVWFHCYEQRKEVLAAEEVDLFAEWVGETPFGELMSLSLLATREEGKRYRIKGVEERIEYLRQASEDGKKSAEARRKKYGTAQPGAEGNSKDSRRSSEGTFDDSRTSSSSSSSSLPLSHDLKTKIPPGDKAPVGALSPQEVLPVVSEIPKKRRELKKVGSEVPGFLVQTFVAAYVTAWKSRYGAKGRPDIDGRVLGQIKRFLSGRYHDEACQMIQVYCQMDDDWFKKKCHDFSTFTQNTTKILAALHSGSQTPGKKSWEDLLAEEEKENANG